MTVPVSTVPAVSSYLLSAITTAAAGDPLANVMLIRLGEPTRNMPPDVILIGGVRRTVEPNAFVGSGGQYFLRESYDLSVLCSSWQGAGDANAESTQATQINDRAWQLVSYLETAVRNDPSLGELVDVAYPGASTSLGPEWTAGPVGLIVTVEVPIHVEATL